MRTVSIKLDLRLLCALLLAVILGMLMVWQPWEEQAGRKTITVTGLATIEEVPDQYVFTPSFSAGAATSAEAVAKVSQKGNEVIQALKNMGIRDDQLTTRVDSNESGPEPLLYPPRGTQSSEPFTAHYYIVCKIKDKNLAQQVTDYLAKSGATGGITPQAEFSQDSRTQLDAQIRQKALQDARAKAETEAKELGIKLGEVVSVSEDPNRSIMPYAAKAEDLARSSASSPPVLTGTQQMSLALTVTFSIK